MHGFLEEATLRSLKLEEEKIDRSKGNGVCGFRGRS